MQREYEINVDFDLSLRPYWSGDDRESFARQFGEFGYHLLLIGDAEDSIRLDGSVPGDYADYLGRLGFSIPGITLRPGTRREAAFVPFGWNDAAADLNLRYERPSDHPPIDVVRRVNGREFAAAS